MRRRTPDQFLGPDAASERGRDRARQVASVVWRSVQERIQHGISDPRLQGMVSVVGVEVTPDLERATIRVSVLPEDRAGLSLSALRSAAGMLRAHLRTATSLRRPPVLFFDHDRTQSTSAAITQALGRKDAPPEEPA